MSKEELTLTSLTYQLLIAERSIRIMDTITIDWLDDETKHHFIDIAETKRTKILNQINAIRTGKKFEEYLNQRDENLLGNYQPEAGPRCQLNNEPKQPCNNG